MARRALVPSVLDASHADAVTAFTPPGPLAGPVDTIAAAILTAANPPPELADIARKSARKAALHFALELISLQATSLRAELTAMNRNGTSGNGHKPEPAHADPDHPDHGHPVTKAIRKQWRKRGKVHRSTGSGKATGSDGRKLAELVTATHPCAVCGRKFETTPSHAKRQRRCERPECIRQFKTDYMRKWKAKQGGEA